MKSKVLVVIVLSFVLLTINLGSWGITETSESRYAEISHEMLVKHDYIHPYLLDIHHYHKPPLTYLITTLGYDLFGVNEFGARFFLQIAILIQLILVYNIALLFYKKKKIAFSAMLIYFSFPIVIISSRNLTTDAYLTTTVLASIFFWLYYKLRASKPIFIYLFFISLGLSFEVKGPVGLIFPVVFIMSHRLITKEKLKITTHHIIGFILFLAVSLAWYVIVFIENPMLYNYFFKEQIVNRISSKSYNRSKPFWFYLLTLPAIGLPWIFFLCHQTYKGFKNIKNQKSYSLILIWTISTIIILFSAFKTKLILYILPSFGFVAILTAKLLSQTSPKTLKKYNLIIISFIGLIASSLIVLSIIDLKFNYSLITAIIISLLVSIFIVLVLKNNKGLLRTSILGYLLGAFLLTSGTQFLKLNDSELNSTREVFKFINTKLPQKENIVVYNYLIASSQFYSDKKVYILNDGHNTVQRETQFETSTNWKDYNFNLHTENGINKAKNILNKNAVLITRKKHDIQEHNKYLKRNLPNRKEIGTWVIYY